MPNPVPELSDILARAEQRARALSVPELARLVSLSDPDERQLVHDAARRLKERFCGTAVSLRGLIELGNVCQKDCLYCGIRRSNASLSRYRLTADDVVRMAETVRDAGYASLALQSGEIESEANTRFIEDCLRRIAPLDLGVTLSLGEQSTDTYRRWKDAGATRYLLRIETSDPRLYAELHPADHSWSRRVSCLKALRQIGYQVGTGVMCALPGQTAEDLARDIVFFGDIDADMIGMGPYIPHPDTPLAARAATEAPPLTNADRLRLGVNMIAAVRLYLHDVNIAATTALQTLAPNGRELGILAGANVIMPNATDVQYRKGYRLYAGKPSADETTKDSRSELERHLAAIGATVNLGKRGDSPHFFARAAGAPDRAT